MKRFLITTLVLFTGFLAWSQTETINLNGHGQGLILDNSADDAGTYINIIDHDGKRANIASFDDNYRDDKYKNALQFFARNGKDMRFATSTDGGSGTNKLTILNNGNIGIGTSTPYQKLSLIDGQLFFGHNSANQFESGRLRFSEFTNTFQGAFLHYDGSTNIFNIGVHNVNDSNTSNDYNSISIRRDNGNVGIGTTSTGTHKLAVEGSIGAREIKVEASGWSDFVFKNDYDLRTLEEVEQHINENGHLPEIPSESHVIENGINLGEMNAKLLQKIEELTLYMIDLNKQLKSQSDRMEQLEQENSELKKEVSAMKND